MLRLIFFVSILSVFISSLLRLQWNLVSLVIEQKVLECEIPIFHLFHVLFVQSSYDPIEQSCLSDYLPILLSNNSAFVESLNLDYFLKNNYKKNVYINVLIKITEPKLCRLILHAAEHVIEAHLSLLCLNQSLHQVLQIHYHPLSFLAKAKHPLYLSGSFLHFIIYLAPLLLLHLGFKAINSFSLLFDDLL